MKLAALAVVLLVALAVPVAISAAGPLPSPSDALDRALTLVEEASRAPAAERGALARAALAALEADVGLARQAWLLEPLQAAPPDLTRARARLAAARAALAVPLENGLDAAAARAALDDVLADARFHPPSLLSLLPDWLVPVALRIGSVARFVWNVVRWPFDRLLDLLRLFLAGPAFGPAMVALALLATAGLVLLYRRGLRAAILAQAEVASPPVSLPPTAAEAMAAAQRHAAQGRFRDACHFAFLATFLWIEEGGHARFDRAATNREHLARLAAQPPLAAAMAPLVACFDRLWYGQDTVTEADYRGLLALAGRVQDVKREA